MGNAHRETREANTDSRRLDGLAKKDDHARGGGGEPLFIRVEDALRRQAAGTNEWKTAGPPTGSISVSPPQGERRLAGEENGFFPFCQAAQYCKSRGTQENCSCHMKTHCDGITAVRERGDGHVVHPLTDLGMWVSEDGHRRPFSSTSKKFVSGSNKTASQVDLAFTHSFHNSHDKATGDFTSITFRLEDFDDAEEDLRIHRSTLSLPSARVINLDTQLLRPLTSPAYSGNSLFMTSQSLGGHLTPHGEQMVFDNDSFADLSHNLESWMSLLPEALQHLPLNYLYIPGSHDSFSYSLNPGGEVGPDTPGSVRRLVGVAPCLARPALLRWSVTQRATLIEQLRHGVRYFDIRVATRESKFYFVHGLFGADLQPLLSEVRLFLAQHPGEVVLLDFQHFHGLSEQDHASLVALLRSTFATALCPMFNHPHNLTLDLLARLKYQVLAFYRHAAGRKDVPWLWPTDTLPNPWPSATTVSAMFTFLQVRLAARDPHTFFVTQCVLTPSGSYLARNMCGKLELNLAAPTNEMLPSWLQGLPSGPPGANVVMTDFVEHNSWEVPRAVINKNMDIILPPHSPLEK